MKQESNHLTEAYQGKYGQELAEKVKERAQWVVSQTKGNRVLDIGCNQGLLSIELAKAGKKVTGVDADKEAIHFANQALEKESEEIKKNVSFQPIDILKDSLEESDFDTIILSEVLEQFKSSKNMLGAACDLAKENGTVVVTVPFGINDYSDQKRTFYFQEIYQEVKQYFKVEDIAFIGDSVGVVGSKVATKSRGPIPARYIKRLEKAFFKLERELIDEKTDKEEAIRRLKQEKERLRADLLTAENAAQEQSSDYSGNSKTNSMEATEKLNQQLLELKSENEKLKRTEKELFRINDTLRKELKNAVNLNKYWERKLERLLKDFHKLDEKWTKKFQGLKKQTQAIQRGYQLYIKQLKNKNNGG